MCADQGRWEQAYRAHVRSDEARGALQATQDASRALLAQADCDSLTARRDRDHYRHLATTDVLTSLPDRRAVQEHVETLLAAVQGEDPDLFAARLGGEEFVVVHPGGADRARRVAEHVRLEVAGRDWSALCPGLPVTVSIGAVSTREGPGTFSALLSTADARPHAAERTGRNRVVGAECPPGQDVPGTGRSPVLQHPPPRRRRP